MRDYANIITAIWRDDRFRALNAGPQRTYLMLITQEDISGAGTLPLTVRRWATNAADTTRDGIEVDLKVLEAAEFVFVDEDTEEVLVRTFVKHDKGFTNPKRKPVILTAAKAVRSLKLRRVLWAELSRLDLVDSLPALPDPSTDSLSISHTPENRVVVTVVPPNTSTLNPQSTNQNASRSSAPSRGKPKRRLPDEFAATPTMVAWAREHTPLVGQRDTDAFVDHWRGNGQVKADWEAAWRNWMRKAQSDAERYAARFNGRASPNRQLVDHDGMLLKPETLADLERTKRFEALDANGQQLAIGGPA